MLCVYWVFNCIQTSVNYSKWQMQLFVEEEARDNTVNNIRAHASGTLGLLTSVDERVHT